MKLFLFVRPFLNKEKANLSEDDVKWRWVPYFRETNSMPSFSSASQSTCMTEKDVSRTIWDHSDVLLNMTNGKGLVVFSYGPPLSGKTCLLLGGRMARLAKYKDDCAPPTSIFSSDVSHSYAVTPAQRSPPSEVKNSCTTLEELRRQYLALLGTEQEKEFGEDSALSSFLDETAQPLRKKGTLYVSAVEYFNCEWFDLLSQEVANLNCLKNGCWKHFESTEECYSFLVKAQNRRLEPSLAAVSHSISHLIIRIRFKPSRGNPCSESIAYFIDLAGCGEKDKEAVNLIKKHKVDTELSLTELRYRMLGRPQEGRVSNRSCYDQKDQKKADRWSGFLSEILDQDPCTIHGLFTIPPSGRDNSDTEDTLHFLLQLSKQKKRLPKLKKILLPKVDQERLSSSTGTTQYNTNGTYSCSADASTFQRSSASSPEIATKAAGYPLHPFLPPTSAKTASEGKRYCRSRKKMCSKPNLQNSMLAALGCINSGSRAPASSTLMYLSQHEEKSRLAIEQTENRARDLLKIRWERNISRHFFFL